MPGDVYPPPPKLVRKRLDEAGVAAHFRELAEHAQGVEVRVKEAAARQSDASKDGLEELGRRLVAGELIAVQVWFFQDDSWWCDTVMRAHEGARDHGFRLVRMQGEEPPSAR